MQQRGLRGVAVTGIGILSPIGNASTELFVNLMNGISGIRKIDAGYSLPLAGKLAATLNFDPSAYFAKKQISALDRVSQIAIVAASLAWSDAGIVLEGDDGCRCGVSLGTGMGGALSLDGVCLNLYREELLRVSPLSIIKIMANAAASHISIKYGLAGPCLTYSTACSSSAVAIGEAYRQIRAGYTDVMIAGGMESLITFVSFKCWESLGVLAVEDSNNPSASCKPFAKDRTGFVLGEGAAIVVLEEMERAKKRGADIYGELIGYGSTADAHHITGPSVSGQVRAMRQAIDEAKIEPDKIDYINAHGTATSANDNVETQAIKAVFGDRAYRIPVSSTKSMHGHLMGAAGAMECAISLLSIKHKSVPPTANLWVPDPECDLDYVPNEGRTGLNIKTVMSNSFAFGGTNAVLIVREV
jgi:beta-ketoacyl-acyl-carrier-protein synthase II